MDKIRKFEKIHFSNLLVRLLPLLRPELRVRLTMGTFNILPPCGEAFLVFPISCLLKHQGDLRSIGKVVSRPQLLLRFRNQKSKINVGAMLNKTVLGLDSLSHYLKKYIKLDL